MALPKDIWDKLQPHIFEALKEYAKRKKLHHFEAVFRFTSSSHDPSVVCTIENFMKDVRIRTSNGYMSYEYFKDKIETLMDEAMEQINEWKDTESEIFEDDVSEIYGTLLENLLEDLSSPSNREIGEK